MANIKFKSIAIWYTLCIDWSRGSLKSASKLERMFERRKLEENSKTKHTRMTGSFAREKKIEVVYFE